MQVIVLRGYKPEPPTKVAGGGKNNALQGHKPKLGGKRRNSAKTQGKYISDSNLEAYNFTGMGVMESTSGPHR